jgi:hypothetical protein
MTPTTASHEEVMRSQLNAITPGICDRLHDIGTLELAVARRIVAVIVGFCCTSQHVGAIVAGRNAFRQLPRGWLASHLRGVIDGQLNLSDPWEYRRLLELLTQSYPELLPSYVAMGAGSQDEEIRETAHDFSQAAT